MYSSKESISLLMYTHFVPQDVSSYLLSLHHLIFVVLLPDITQAYNYLQSD